MHYALPPLPSILQRQVAISIAVESWRGQIWKATKVWTMTAPMMKKVPKDGLRPRGSRKESPPRSRETRTGNGSTIRKSRPNAAREAGSKAAKRRTAQNSRSLTQGGSRRGKDPSFRGWIPPHILGGVAGVVVQGSNLAIRPLGHIAVPCSGSGRHSARCNSSHPRPPYSKMSAGRAVASGPGSFRMDNSTLT